MSSVSGVSSSLDLYQVLQQVSSTDTTSTATSLQQLDAGQTQAAPPSGHHHHGHGLHGKIESAVSSALQSADPTEDPNQVVQDAIAGVLKGQDSDGGGTNTSNLQAQGSQGSQASTGSSSVSSGDFTQLLKAHGIDAQQFQNDLQDALNTDGTGQSVDFSKLFHSFPTGSAIDETA